MSLKTEKKSDLPLWEGCAARARQTPEVTALIDATQSLRTYGALRVEKRMPGSWPGCACAQAPEAVRQAIRSLTVLVAPLFFTESMPASRDCAVAYIWLVPMTWWLAAFRLKNDLPLEASLRS